MQVRQAYEVLIDPNQRMDYDIRTDGLFAWERDQPGLHAAHASPLPCTRWPLSLQHHITATHPSPPVRTPRLVHSAEQYAIVGLACIVAFLLSSRCSQFIRGAGAEPYIPLV